MNDQQLIQLKQSYVQMIVDDMDMKTMMIMVYDMILDNMKDYTEEDVKAEVTDLYGEEVLEDLIASA